MRRSTWLVPLTFAATVALSAPWASAEEPAAAQAIEEGRTGVELYERSRWEEALARFRTAEALYHSPVFVLYQARCLRHLNRWRDARPLFEKVAAEPLPPTAPDPWAAAQRDATAELAALDAAMPRVVVRLRGGTSAAAAHVDGGRVEVGATVELDPGLHRFTATDRGVATEKNATLEPGRAVQEIVLELPRRAAGGGEPSAGERRGAAGRAPDAGPYVPGVALAATGGAALLAGGVLGVLALRRADDTITTLPDSCVGRVCPEGRRSQITGDQDAARSLATASTALMIGGAVVTATGVVLWLVDPRATRPPRTAIRGVAFDL